MAQGVFVIAEQQDGVFRKVTFEAVSEARRIADALGAEVSAAVLGAGVKSSAEELGKYGADHVLAVDDPALAEYTTDAYVNVLAGLIQAQAPEVILVGATAQGKDLSARLAARLDAGLAMECIGIEHKNDGLTFKRPMYGGKAIAEVAIEGTPKIAAIRPNVMSINENPRAATIVKQDAAVGEVRTIIKEKRVEAGNKVELTEADIIVSGGRGTGGEYGPIEELAALLCAAVGASRSAVDEGWRPHSDQVGQTGKVVSPNLYIACGISGAIQHLAGMSTSKYIVAVNKDPEAPIFTKADFGIVGDLFEVVPAVIREVQKIRS